VAIIGMGAMFPAAEDLSRYWANIQKCADAITEVPDSHWEPADYFDRDPHAADRTYAHRGGFLTPVDFPLLEFGIAPHAVEAIDSTQLLGLLVAKAALEDAGYGGSRPFDRDRASVILGVTGTLELVVPLAARLGHPIWRRALQAAGVDPHTSEEVVRRIGASYVGWQEHSFPGLLGNVAAGRIANRLDLRGANCVVDAACASSLGAVNLAVHELSSRRCDLVISGGLDTFNDIFMYMCFSKTPALSPSGEARPFDADADGTILGEGLGVLVLKRLADARRDGDRVYAVITAIGASSDGKGQAVYAPCAAGQVKALRAAYELAGISPGTIELVEAHGTGTRVGDAIELAALSEVFGGARPAGSWCALGSVKSQIGHTKAAAGAAGLIKAALALHHKVLPPTAKVRRPIEPLLHPGAPFYLNAEARPWPSSPGHPRRAAVSAFGFGGSNFHCVLEEAEPEKGAIDWDGDIQILAYSADDRTEIADSLKALARPRAWDEVRIEAARLRARFQPGSRHRLLLVTQRDKCDLSSLAADAAARLGVHAPESSSLTGNEPSAVTGRPCARRIFQGAGPPPGQLAVLFPGQGSQYVGMLRELACRFPRMQTALALLDSTADGDGPRLSSRIYPPAVFTAKERAAQEEALKDTRGAQPAIGAVSLGLLRLLEDFGVRPEMAAGHSFGELTALCAGGRFDERTFLSLARHRGKLLAERAAQGGSGAMLAVMASLEEVLAVLHEHALDVEVANKNAPRQYVLSGSQHEIERARQFLAERKIATHLLAVSAAFHSRFVAGARAAFRATLESVTPTAATLPVFANSTAEAYPADCDGLKDLLACQLERPVEFVQVIEAMYLMGARTFLEVGPDARLAPLVSAILEGNAHVSLAVDASRGASRNLFDLACALATLAALGYAVDLKRWDETAPERDVPVRNPGLTVKVCGANPRPAAERSVGETRQIGEGVTASSAPEERHHAQLNKTSSLPERMQTHRCNGQPRSCTVLPSETSRSGAIERGAVPPPDPVPARGILARSLRNAQDNLVALQRIAEETAALHRMFLEGQEKTQRTLLKLLEEEQKVARALVHEEEAGWPSPADSLAVRDVRAEPATPVFDGDTTGCTDEPDRNGQCALTRPPVRAHVAEAARARSSIDAQRGAALASLDSLLIQVVAEKTGYPPEALELDMQLDADLGIDSIKRVEILSALQERALGMPPLQGEQLSSFRTLRAIAEFITSGARVTGDARRQEPARPTVATGDNARERIAQVVLATVAEKTGYPVEMLELPMQLDTDLGIDSIKRVEIFAALQELLPDVPQLRPDEIGALRTLRGIAEALSVGQAFQPDGSRAVGQAFQPDISGGAHGSSDPTDRTEGPIATGPTYGSVAPPKPVLARLYPRVVPLTAPERRAEIPLSPGALVWVTNDGSSLTESMRAVLVHRGYSAQVIEIENPPAVPENLRGLILLAPVERCEESFIRQAFRLLRAAGETLNRSGLAGAASLVAVSRLDGRFGVEGLPAEVNPASGALAGMCKTAAHEWASVHCKALDLERGFDAPDLVARLIVEELLFRGPAEVGLTRAGRTEVDLQRAACLEPRQKRRAPIREGDLIVASGGARGITAEVAVALAAAFRPRLVLLGRSAMPTPEEPWPDELPTEVELKRALVARAGRPLSARELGEQARQARAQHEIRRNLGRIAAAGSPVVYHSVDVRDRAGVRAVLAQIRAEFGPVRGLIHGAGALADRLITNQTDEEFDLVYDTKVNGLEHLCDELDLESLALLALFSSSSARFGRTGQVAYAAANEYLNKWAQRQATRLPHCRVVSFNWGPWAGGMVTESLREVFEKEGLALIRPEAGGQIAVEELLDENASSVEIVVLARHPSPPRVPEAHPILTRCASEGSFPTPAREARSKGAHAAPAVRRKQDAVLTREVSLESLPVLGSHVIDRHAVLPLALILEWLAEGALQRNPGLMVSGIDSLRLFKGVILNERPAVAVEIRAGKAVPVESHYSVPVELSGRLASGNEVAHVRADVILAEELPDASDSSRISNGLLSPYPRSCEEIYRTVLFHGPALRGIERIDGCSERGVAGWVASAPPPSRWIARPMRNTWFFDPLAIDCAFQLVVLWCREQLGANSLPTAFGSLRRFGRGFSDEGFGVSVARRSSSAERAVADIEFLDREGNLVARLDSYECVVERALNQAFLRNQLASGLEPSVASTVD
jgi:acyl transferase domain-containing protein/NAD(P)-dependent dehydrogenase (short-subunit alcohol dehydrogenase family)